MLTARAAGHFRAAAEAPASSEFITVVNMHVNERPDRTHNLCFPKRAGCGGIGMLLHGGCSYDISARLYSTLAAWAVIKDSSAK